MEERDEITQIALMKINHGFPAEKSNRNHQRVCNGFTGYNGTCIGFNGNCNGRCGSLLVIGRLLLVAC